EGPCRSGWPSGIRRIAAAVAPLGGTAPSARADGACACATAWPAPADAIANAAAAARSDEERPRISNLSRRIVRACARRGAPISLAAARVHFPLHDRAVGHREPRRDDVAVDRGGGLQHDALVRREIAGDRAADRNRLRREIGLHLGARPDHQAVIADLDGAFDLAVDGEVLLADDPPLDAERLPDPRGDAAFIGRRVDVVRHSTPCGTESYPGASGARTRAGATRRHDA